MTDVYLHGILKKEYQNCFKLNLSSPHDVIRAIDCNRKGFKGRVIELTSQGCIYDILVDKKKIKSLDELNSFNSFKRIDMVPVILGAGGLETVILNAIFGAATVELGAGAMLAATLKAVAFAAIAYAITPKPDLGLPAQQDISARVNAGKESYIFSSNVNLAQQGTFLPIGYGRLKIGSSVIQTSIKSYPLIKPDNLALQTNNFIDKSTNSPSITANSFIN
jgi:predicted phage tail protein